MRAWCGEAIVVIVTFLLMVFDDLAAGVVVGIVVGFALGGLVFIRRMADNGAVEAEAEFDPTQGDALIFR